MRSVNILTNAAGMQMIQEAIEQEIKKQLVTSPGLWQRFQDGKAAYSSLKLEDIERAFGTYFGKKKPKRIRRKMKKHGPII